MKTGRQTYTTAIVASNLVPEKLNKHYYETDGNEDKYFVNEEKKTTSKPGLHH